MVRGLSCKKAKTCLLWNLRWGQQALSLTLFWKSATSWASRHCSKVTILLAGPLFWCLLVEFSKSRVCSGQSVVGGRRSWEARCVGVRRPVGSEKEILPRLSGKLAQWEAFREGGSKLSLKDRDPGRGRKSAHTWSLDSDRVGRPGVRGRAMSTHSLKEAIFKRREIVPGVGRSRA